MNRLLLLLPIFAACADPTQLLVVVHSDLPTSELLKVQATILGEDEVTPVAVEIFRVSEIPFSFGVVPAKTAPTKSGRVEVRLEAFGPNDGVLDIGQRAITRFQEGKTLLLPMRLYRLCAALDCPAPRETCVDGRCGSPDRGDLEVVEPGTEIDRVQLPPVFAPDAAVVVEDAGARDSGVHPDATVFADAMPPRDMGVQSDAMVFADAMPRDASPLDAMPPPDSGIFPDAGDAMIPLDATVPDGGSGCEGLATCSAMAGSTCPGGTCCDFPIQGNRTMCFPACTGAPNQCPAPWECPPNMMMPNFPRPCELRCSPQSPCPAPMLCLPGGGNGICRPPP